MRKAKRRVRINFGGISFVGMEHVEDLVVVPRNALRKILMRGKVSCICTGIQTDDYKSDAEANFQRGPVSAQSLVEYTYEKAWLLYYSEKKNEIRFCPMQSMSYDIREK